MPALPRAVRVAGRAAHGDGAGATSEADADALDADSDDEVLVADQPLEPRGAGRGRIAADAAVRADACRRPSAR